MIELPIWLLVIICVLAVPGALFVLFLLAAAMLLSVDLFADWGEKFWKKDEPGGSD